MNIRGKSIGESVELIVTCQDDNETKVPLTVKMSDIKLEVPKGHTDMIKLNDDLNIKMKYPSMQQFLDNNFAVSDLDGAERIDKAFDAVVDCIDTIFTVDEAWSATDCTKKELNDFLDSMNSTQFKQIEKFFESMPKLSHTVKVLNPNTKVESDVVLEGLASFFA